MSKLKEDEYYILSYGTYWEYVKEKPSWLKRHYCFWMGAFITLSPILIPAIVCIAAIIYTK